MATRFAKPLVWAPAEPPPMASAGRLAANSRATSRIFSAEEPIDPATVSGANGVRSKAPPLVSASAAARSPRSFETMTWAMLKANTPSIPGLTYSHRSALAEVMEKRESACVRVPRSRSFPWRKFPYPRAYRTGEPQVLRKSAPKDRTYAAFSMSKSGMTSWPKTCFIASRSVVLSRAL